MHLLACTLSILQLLCNITQAIPFHPTSLHQHSLRVLGAAGNLIVVTHVMVAHLCTLFISTFNFLLLFLPLFLTFYLYFYSFTSFISFYFCHPFTFLLECTYLLALCLFYSYCVI